MKKQEGEFLKKRDKVRHHLIMTRLCQSDRNTLYQKLMQQQVNKKYNAPLNDKEQATLDERLQVVIDACKDLQDELRRPDSDQIDRVLNVMKS